jgi:cellobiose-specific phosphotransferase system component IIC
MFIIASMPLWVLSAMFLVGACVPVLERKKATDDMAIRLILGLVYSALFAVIAGLVCRI